MTLLRFLWKPALMLAGLAAAGLLLRAIGFDPRNAIGSAGRHGPLAYVVIAALACAVGVPRQVAAMAAGYAFGFWPGTLLALIAQIGGCAIDFAWARLLGRRAASRLLARREGGRLDRLDRFLSQRAFTATLTLRLLPMGNNLLLNLAAGLSGVASVPFLLASVLGYTPQTVVFALAGAGSGLSDGLRIGVAALLLLLSIALGVVLMRRRPMPV